MEKQAIVSVARFGWGKRPWRRSLATGIRRSSSEINSPESVLIHLPTTTRNIPSFCLSVCVFGCLPACLPACLPVCLNASLHIFPYLFCHCVSLILFIPLWIFSTVYYVSTLYFNCNFNKTFIKVPPNDSEAFSTQGSAITNK